MLFDIHTVENGVIIKASKGSAFRQQFPLLFQFFEISEPLDIPGYSEISKAADETGEMWFLNENFGSYLTGNEGYGIAFSVEKRSDAVYQPDHWYAFE